MMKNYSFVFLFFIVFAHCQKIYNFNFLTRYEVRNVQTTNDWHANHYFNTENGDYYLIISYANEKKMKAKLVDFGGKIIHRFAVKERKRKKEILYDFIYENSSIIPGSARDERYRYSFANMDEGSVSLQYQDNYRRKEMLYDVNLKVKPREKSLFPVFAQMAFLPYYTADIVNCEDNCLVENAEMKWDDYSCNFKLIDYEDTTLAVNVPAKLVFFKDNFRFTLK